MQAEVVGIKRLDFTGRDGKAVKKTMLYVVFNGDNVEGHETGVTSWDELAKGKAPLTALGEVIEVEYNKYGKLIFLEKMGK